MNLARLGRLHQVLHGWELVERRGTGFRTTDALAREVDRFGTLGVVYGLFRADPWTGRDHRTGIPAAARAEVAELVQQAVRERGTGEGVLLAEEAAHGLLVLDQVVLPTNLAQGGTWSPRLVREAAQQVGLAARADGVHLVLVSGLDMLREPRWGRSEECLTEAPRLAADLVRELVVGLQGRGPDQPWHPDHPGAVVKHLAGQGAARAGLNSASATIGPRELREIHLPACRAAVQAGAAGVMAAYNDIDGMPCIANRWLLTDLLRTEWGFGGIVMSDAFAIDRLAEATGARRAAELALLAGCDLNMGDLCWAELADMPWLDEALDAAEARVLQLKQRHGLLSGQVEDRPAAPARESLELAARRLTEAVPTLLQGRLEPIATDAAVVVVGDHASSPGSMLGDYTATRPEHDPVDLASALTSRFPQARVVDWRSETLAAELAGAEVVVCQVGGTSERTNSTFTAFGASEQAQAATCGEGVDRADLSLPDGQDEQLRRLRECFAGRVVVVAVMGRPHLLTTAAACCDDLLVAWYPGEFGAETIARLLAGEIDPQGRLPVTLLAHPGAVGTHDDDRVGAEVPGYQDLAEPVLFELGAGHGRAQGRLLDHQLAASPDGWTLRLGLASDRPSNELVAVFARSHGGGLWPRRRRLVAHARLQVTEQRTEACLTLARHELLPDGDHACTLAVPMLGLELDLSETPSPSPLAHPRPDTAPPEENR